jgi:hypothetical protein
MKIKEEQPLKLNEYTDRIYGRVQFWFTKKELPSVFAEIDNYVCILNERNPQYQLIFDFSWHYSSADLHWSRPLTDDEKLKVKELKRQHRIEIKKLEKKQAIKLAKKFKLIK